MGQGVPHSASSLTGEGNQFLTLPTVPSRVTKKQAGNVDAGFQGNVPQGAISYISSIPQVNCPDMQIFQEDRSYMTDETDVSSLDESEWASPEEEEVPDEAIPLGGELVGESYMGVTKSGVEKPVPIKASSSHKSRSHMEIAQNPKKSSLPYQDYRLDNSKNLSKANRQAKVAKGSAAAVPQQSMTMPANIGNAARGAGNILEGGQGLPVYSLSGHPDLTQYVQQVVQQTVQQVSGAQGNHPQQPS